MNEIADRSAAEARTQTDMLEIISLKSLFEYQVDDASSAPELALSRFLSSKIPPSETLLDPLQRLDPFCSEELLIRNWRSLLELNLLCATSEHHLEEMQKMVRLFERQGWNQNSQYLRSLVALNHALAKMPIPEVGPHLLESGAALIELDEYCPWLALPYTPYHFEFGVYLGMLALMMNRSDFKEIVIRIAQWQINLLGCDANPLPAIFVREGEGQSITRLCLSYLLFKIASIFIEESSFETYAASALKAIHCQVLESKKKIEALFVLIELWLDHRPVLSQAEMKLPEHIYDPSTALVGYRAKDQHVLCTLHGEHTGLGCFRYGDVEIVNFGPQYLPLADCNGFGIEGNALTDYGIRRSIIEWRPGSFILKGCTRMVDQPGCDGALMGNFRGIWLEVTQEFKKPHFYLKTSFLGLDGWDSVAISYFVKASRCRIASQILKPRTFDRYEGIGQTVALEGQEYTLELRLLASQGQMHVIPLAGDDSFWGADFLVAYLTAPQQRHYQWHIAPVKKESAQIAEL